MNTENLSPAMTKAIEARGTNNAVIGNALVKRGIMEIEDGGATKYVLSMEYLTSIGEYEDGTKQEREMGRAEAAVEVSIRETLPRGQFEETEAGPMTIRKVSEIEQAEETIAAFLEAAPAFEIKPEDIPMDVVESVKTLKGANVIEAKRVTPADVNMDPADFAEWKTRGERRYRIEFERIGRHNPKPLRIACFERPDVIAQKVHRYAENFLTSRAFEVDVEIQGASGTVTIEGGRFGTGRISIEERA